MKARVEAEHRGPGRPVTVGVARRADGTAASPIPVRLPSETLERIDALAEERDVSRSEVIRDALDAPVFHNRMRAGVNATAEEREKRLGLLESVLKALGFVGPAREAGIGQMVVKGVIREKEAEELRRRGGK